MTEHPRTAPGLRPARGSFKAPARHRGPAVGSALAGVVSAALLAACASKAPPQTPAATPLLPEVQQALALGERTAPVPVAPTRLPDPVVRDLLPPVALTTPVLSPRQAEPRFDLNIANATPQELFAAIVTDTRYSMLVDPDLKGRLTLRLKDVTVKEALDAVRDLYGFEHRIQGPRIIVSAPTVQTRLFKVNYIISQRSGRSEVRVMSGSLGNSGGGSGASGGAGGAGGAGGSAGAGAGSGSAAEGSRITTQSRNDFWGELEASLKLIIGDKEGRQVIVSPQTGTVLVRAMPQELRVAEQFLQMARLNVERQVMLEAKIVEVKLNDSMQTGINWALFRQGSGSRASVGLASPGVELRSTGEVASGSLTIEPGVSLANAATAAGSVFGLALQTANFASLLNFLETQGSVQVLSSPRIATLNNQKAVLKVGTDDFFVTNVTTTSTAGSGSGGNITSPTISMQSFFSGIALDVLPQIDADGNIILHVHPSVSDVRERAKLVNLGSLGSFTLPLASSSVNETDSIVRVRDGHIVAIGGLMRQTSSNERSRIPGLGEVPVLGAAFRQSNREITKHELVILIKPTVVHSDLQDSLDEVADAQGGRASNELRTPTLSKR